MKTLVIHPEDRSTRFLSRVYENIDVTTLVTGGVSQLELRDMIESHDQVMMMGHGSPLGLMSMGKFPENGFVINDSHAPLLAKKDNSVFIWCYADQYVHYNELKGFYTGMFISEPNEAWMMNIKATDPEVEESNDVFGKTVGMMASRGPRLMWAAATHKGGHYGRLAEKNAVARYNHERLYFSPKLL